VLTTDEATLSGLDLVDLPAPMAAALKEALPKEASVRNPLDLLADAREDRFGETLAIAMAHGAAFDVILMIHVVPFMVDADPVIARLAKDAAACDLPLMHSMMGTLEQRDRWFASMEQAGVPMFSNSEDMARTAGILAQCHDVREKQA
jgi:acetyltransferase